MNRVLILIIIILKSLPVASQVDSSIYYRLDVMYDYSPINTKDFDGLLRANNYPLFDNFKSNWGVGFSVMQRPFIGKVVFTGLNKKTIENSGFKSKISCSSLTLELGWDLLKKNSVSSLYPYLGLKAIMLDYSLQEKTSSGFNTFLSDRILEKKLYYYSGAVDIGFGFEHHTYGTHTFGIVTIGINVGASIDLRGRDWVDTGVDTKLGNGPVISQSYYHIKAILGFGIKRCKK